MNVQVGEVLYLQESDYRYGTGALVLRVTEILGTNMGDGWIELQGIEVSLNGQEMGQRGASVRMSALKGPRTRRH